MNCKWCEKWQRASDSWSPDHCSAECAIASKNHEKANKQKNASFINLSDGVFFMGMVMLIIAFSGKPDLIDAIIFYLMN